jgi:hypothetical protein
MKALATGIEFLSFWWNSAFCPRKIKPIPGYHVTPSSWVVNDKTLVILRYFLWTDFHQRVLVVTSRMYHWHLFPDYIIFIFPKRIRKIEKWRCNRLGKVWDQWKEIQLVKELEERKCYRKRWSGRGYFGLLASSSSFCSTSVFPFHCQPPPTGAHNSPTFYFLLAHFLFRNYFGASKK